MMNKSSNLGNISQISSNKRSNSFDGRTKPTLGCTDQPKNTRMLKKSFDGARKHGRRNSEIPHNKLIESEEAETVDQRVDTHIMKSKRRRNSQTKIEKRRVFEANF